MRTAVTNVGPGVITIELVKVRSLFFVTYAYSYSVSQPFATVSLSLVIHLQLHRCYSST